MITQAVRFAALTLGAIITVTLWGCYTQLGTVEGEQNGDGYTSSSGQTANVYDGEYYGGAVDYLDGDWAYQPSIGFSYYYPPVWPSEVFGFEYDRTLWDGYGPSYGPVYGSPWHPTPSYGAFGYPYYYSPSHSMYIPAYQYARVAGYGSMPASTSNAQPNATGGMRNFGVQRSETPSSGGTPMLPNAGAIQRPSGGGLLPQAGAVDKSRPAGSTRGGSVTPADTASGKSGSGGTRSPGTRSDRRRDTVPTPSRPVETPTPSPAPAAPSGDQRRSGDSRGTPPTTSPAPSPPPQPPARDTSSTRRGRGG